MNIPALSESTLRRDIAASDISLDSNIQVNIIIDFSKQPCACMQPFALQTSILDEAARVHPSSWWWIKADGCDVVSGLGESVSGEWSGDVNLKQDILDSAYKKHKERLEWVTHLGLDERRNDLDDDLDLIAYQVTDVKFVADSK